MLDLGTEYREFYSSVTKKAEKVQQQIEEFYGDTPRKEVHSDGAQEFRKWYAGSEARIEVSCAHEWVLRGLGVFRVCV